MAHYHAYHMKANWLDGLTYCYYSYYDLRVSQHLQVTAKMLQLMLQLEYATLQAYSYSPARKVAS